MIALALLLGCDYVPTGVPGVGKETAVKLFTALPGADLLNRFVKRYIPSLDIFFTLNVDCRLPDAY